MVQNPCNSSPCVNSGICSVMTPTSYNCTCPSSWTGQNCELNVNECNLFNQPCKNNALCVDQIGGYVCNCLPGFTGQYCQLQVDVCLSSPCLNGGLCQQPSSNYWKCNCAAGFTGSMCESQVDYCASYPCSQNGICVSKLNGYTCNCNTGYGGTNCNLIIDMCNPNPCINGNCTALIGDYSCQCPPGYAGKRCETYQRQCTNNPCFNNGLCVENGLGGFSCRLSFINVTNLGVGLAHYNTITTIGHYVNIIKKKLFLKRPRAHI